jgi:general secretion pathway protein A
VLSPKASAAVAAASAAFDALDAPAAPPPAPPAQGPRKLIDLFPPPSEALASPGTPVRRKTSLGSSDPKPSPALTPSPTLPPTPAPPPPYQRFYGLAENPFDLSPDPRFQVDWESSDRVLRDLTDAIGRRDGAYLLTGVFGAGKTTLLRALAAQLGRRTLVSVASGTAATAHDLLVTVLVDFGVISRADASNGRLREASRDELASTLRNFLASLAALQAVALIVIDDAHKLPAAVLADLQVLADLVGEQKLLQVLLAGEPDLDAVLQSDTLQTWNRVIAFRAELLPLTAEGVPGYVTHRLAVAGVTDELFEAGALTRVHALSAGVPRTVNLICERALALGQRASARTIDVALIDRAARELGLLTDSPSSSSWTRALMAVLLLVLVLAGAAGAGWIFRDPLARALTRWHLVR